MGNQTVFFEKYCTESVKKPFRGDEVFFDTFPADAENRRRIGRFPFKVTVACPYKRTGPSSYVAYDAPYRVLLKAIHAMGIMWHWTAGAAAGAAPVERQRKQFRRYSTHGSDKFPVVVNIETDLPPQASAEERYRLCSADVVRLWGFCSILSYRDLFLSADRIKCAFPVDECRMFKPGLGSRDLVEMFFSHMGREYRDTPIEEIQFDGGLRSVFKFLHVELSAYRKEKRFDAFTDYVFDLMKCLALKVSNAKRIPTRICPICLHPIPAGSRPEKDYYAPPGYRLREHRQPARSTQARPRKRALDYCQKRSRRIAKVHPHVHTESRAFLDSLVGR